MQKKIDIQFEEAFHKVSNLQSKLPTDIMLKLYAYYKQATKGDKVYCNLNQELIYSGFKLNAWMQLSGMEKKEAKQEYINLVNSITI